MATALEYRWAWSNGQKREGFAAHCSSAERKCQGRSRRKFIFFFHLHVFRLSLSVSMLPICLSQFHKRRIIFQPRLRKRKVFRAKWRILCNLFKAWGKKGIDRLKKIASFRNIKSWNLLFVIFTEIILFYSINLSKLIESDCFVSHIYTEDRLYSKSLSHWTLINNSGLTTSIFICEANIWYFNVSQTPGDKLSNIDLSP